MWFRGCVKLCIDGIGVVVSSDDMGGESDGEEENVCVVDCIGLEEESAELSDIGFTEYWRRFASDNAIGFGDKHNGYVIMAFS